MNYNKPNNLNEIIELQKVLDNKIELSNKLKGTYTERDIRHIIISLIAELIEFNEELECSHKTWKKKEYYNTGKQREELIDCLFFYCQLLIIDKVDTSGLDFILSGFENDLKVDINKEYDSNFLVLECINYANNLDYKKFLYSYLSLAKKLGLNKNSLLDLYFNKWSENLKRIEKPREKGGWL